MELLQHVIRRPAPSRAGRNDQIPGMRRAPHQHPPAMLSPSSENFGEDWMDRDGTRDLGLHRADNLVSGAVALGDEQPPQRNQVRVVVAPGRSCGLAEPLACPNVDDHVEARDDDRGERGPEMLQLLGVPSRYRDRRSRSARSLSSASACSSTRASFRNPSTTPTTSFWTLRDATPLLFRPHFPYRDRSLLALSVDLHVLLDGSAQRVGLAIRYEEVVAK